jgi:xanthine/uracil/vitamin C permease (AzgA family)
VVLVSVAPPTPCLPLHHRPSFFQVGKKFRFQERDATLMKELRAGVVTFLMVAYILAINPSVLGTTGGTCDPKTLCSPESYEERGNACLGDYNNVAARQCVVRMAASKTISIFSSSF